MWYLARRDRKVIPRVIPWLPKKNCEGEQLQNPNMLQNAVGGSDIASACYQFLRLVNKRDKERDNKSMWHLVLATAHNISVSFSSFSKKPWSEDVKSIVFTNIPQVQMATS